MKKGKSMHKHVLATLVLIVAVLTIMVRQHRHFADARRTAAQDRQELLHGRVFHAITFLALQQEHGGVYSESSYDPLLPALKNLTGAANKKGHGELIYAGRALMNAITSEQLRTGLGKEVVWDAILVQQFESQAACEDYLNDPTTQNALKAFDRVYVHGMERSSLLNLVLPQFLLLVKGWRAVTFAPSILPFEPAEQMNHAALEGTNRRLPVSLGEDAIVVVNLIQYGDAAQQDANAEYSMQMLGLMADRGYGPIHIGDAVPVQLPLRFDSVVIVYYPGKKYFRELATSTWFQSIVRDKQLADTQATVTVPITNVLMEAEDQ